MALNLTASDWINIAGLGAGVAGSIASGHGQSMQNQQNNQFSDAQQRRQQLIDFLMGNQKDQYNRDVMGLNAAQVDPLQVQKSRQQQAMFAAILPGLRNASVTPPAGLKGYVPQMSGGFRIPEGGFGADTQAFFTPQARANAEGQFYSAAAPFMNPPNLSQVGYGAAGDDPTAGAQEARNQFNTSQQAKNQAITNAIQQPATTAGADSYGKKKKHSSWWKKALMIAGNVALGVATGSLSVPAQLAIMAGTGAAEGAMGGGGWKGALLGAGTGAAGVGLGRIGGGISGSVPSGIPGGGSITNYLPD